MTDGAPEACTVTNPREIWHTDQSGTPGRGARARPKRGPPDSGAHRRSARRPNRKARTRQATARMSWVRTLWTVGRGGVGEKPFESFTPTGPTSNHTRSWKAARWPNVASAIVPLSLLGQIAEPITAHREHTVCLASLASSKPTWENVGSSAADHISGLNCSRRHPKLARAAG